MAGNADPGNPRNAMEVRGGQGVQIGDHNEQVNQFIETFIDNRLVPAGPAVSSAYSEQVKRIAPLELHGRDGELADRAGPAGLGRGRRRGPYHRGPC
jgi:hypothetical protein